jgi:hypothetical protein
VRGFQCSPKVDLNADFFFSIIRNQEFDCLLRRGVAGRIAGLLLRDAESFKGLPDLRVIIDGEDKCAFQTLRNAAQLSKVLPREDTIPIVVLSS